MCVCARIIWSIVNFGCRSVAPYSVSGIFMTLPYAERCEILWPKNTREKVHGSRTHSLATEWTHRWRMDGKEEEEEEKQQMFGETKRIIDFLNKHHLDTGRAHCSPSLTGTLHAYIRINYIYLASSTHSTVARTARVSLYPENGNANRAPFRLCN